MRGIFVSQKGVVVSGWERVEEKEKRRGRVGEEKRKTGPDGTCPAEQERLVKGR